MEILHIENLSFTYPKCEEKALDNINIGINEGEFIVVCGETGCGKTTLLRLIKKELAPFGKKSGDIIYAGSSVSELEDRRAASEIGFVLQNPDSQIVTDKVWHELAFGLENLGVPTSGIRRRVGEMASYFGIQDWFRNKTDELSGGQKQILNLAAVMVMQPKILILDEPTSQLDPIAASDFIATLRKLNSELGLTVILAEHRLEDVFPIADRVLIMEKGKVLLFDEPKNIGSKLRKINPGHNMLHALPSGVRLYNLLEADGVCPLTVKQAKSFLAKNYTNEISVYPDKSYVPDENIAVSLKDVWFRYEKNTPDIMRGVTIDVCRGELYCILGGNGSGKTTTLSVIAGIKKAYRGKIIINGKKIRDYKSGELYRHMLASLPQNPQTVFLKDTVEADLTEVPLAMDVPKNEIPGKISAVACKLGISHLLAKNPFDLSGGEQQKCALAKVLLSDPQILLLDEPTKGLDANSKLALSNILTTLKKDGITVITVTHDVEFAAENADRCALFFDGEIISADTPQHFFSDNTFYTTAACRISRDMYSCAVTVKAVAEMCRMNGDKNA